jgi:hypothetical protein
MKEFRKNKQGNFICEECNRIFIKKDGLSKHINVNHNGQKEYFNKWIRENEEGICKICGKETKLDKFKGYKNCCCKKCTDEYRFNRVKNGMIQIYDVDNPMKNDKMKEKGEQTRLKKYGVKYPIQCKEIEKIIKETLVKKYGVEYTFQSDEIKEKGKQTKLEKYGNENYNNRDKAKETNLEKYGVEFSAQNEKSFEKGQKTRFEIHQFKDTDLWYQGTYELDFIEKYHNKYPDLQRAPSIKYKFEGKNKVYYPDFFIPLLNLIVEIKSSYLAERDKKEITAKKKATIANSFNYIMIVDKDYSLFENLLNKYNVMISI